MIKLELLIGWNCSGELGYFSNQTNRPNNRPKGGRVPDPSPEKVLPTNRTLTGYAPLEMSPSLTNYGNMINQNTEGTRISGACKQCAKERQLAEIR